MSGDVQQRRRRDKKRKKEEQIEETIVHPQPPPTPILPNDDVNIHVHKERSLGGGVCAKCIFFVLMIVISVIIGFTITEHRGLTDVDVSTSESRFASIFEGWIDKSLDTHDDDDLHAHSEEVSREIEEDDEEHSEEHDEEDIDEEGVSSEEETELEESEQQDEDEEEEVTEEEESEEESQQDDTDEDEEDDENQLAESQEDEETTESQEEDQIAESEEDEEDIVAEESEQEDEQEVSEEEIKEDDKEDTHSDEAVEEDDKIEQTHSEEDKDIEDEETDDYMKENDNPELSTTDRVKSRTKKEQESDSDNDERISISKKSRSGARNVYDFENITNADDYVIRDDLDKAQRHMADNIQLALSLFSNILERHPNSPRALYGKAQALDLWAEKKRSNEILQESIQFYLQVLSANGTPDVLFLTAGQRCINRMRFIGNYGRAIGVHRKLIDRFSNESKYKNDLAVTYLTINRISEARALLIDVLKKWPNDGFALVHYGFILKTVDNELKMAIDYLKRGIETKAVGVIDGRFYFHLGDALARLGKPDEAMKIYEDGVANKVFLSKYQRSLYNVERLTGRPWWNKEQTPYTRLYRQLEQNYRQIREEALAILNKKGYFKDESENLRDTGDWKQFELYARGIKHVENCNRCPLTCKIIDSEPDVKSCRRGQVKFSVMHPGTHVWPHCGPTNCRLRIHLGLKVPPKTYIRVAEETRTWEEGKIFIFDDSFEHEVWHNGTEFRLVLIVDIWHPELTQTEKYNLSAI